METSLLVFMTYITYNVPTILIQFWILEKTQKYLVGKCSLMHFFFFKKIQLTSSITTKPAFSSVKPVNYAHRAEREEKMEASMPGSPTQFYYFVK